MSNSEGVPSRLVALRSADAGRGPTRARRMVLTGGALGLLVMALVPDAAHACAVCFDARAENRMAFLATTAFLSLLPLGMVAGAGAWIRRRVREMDDEEPGLDADGVAPSGPVDSSTPATPGDSALGG